MRLLFIFAFVTIAIAKKDYTNYAVYSAWPESLENKGSLRTVAEGFDVMASYHDDKRKAQILVPPEEESRFLAKMKEGGWNTKKTIANIQDLMDKNDVVVQFNKNARNAPIDWNSYQTLDNINLYLDYMAETYPDIVEVVVGGSSYEGREFKGIKLTFSDTEQVIAIEGGIHAREWISPATVTYIINELVTSNDPDVRRIASTFQWHIFPVINPDGYLFTFNGDRMWRKNRNANHMCNNQTTGVDLNRNFDFHWNTVGVSSDPCQQIFPGASGFSEAESRTFSRYLRSIARNMKLYISFHSFSELLIVPYGHTQEFLDNYHDVFEVGVRAADALAKRYGTQYQVGTSPGILYGVSGTSVDWVRSALNVSLVFLYELRDRGEFGFQLPPNQIIPNCEETMDSLVEIVNRGVELRYFEFGGSSSISALSFLTILIFALIATFQ